MVKGNKSCLWSWWLHLKFKRLVNNTLLFQLDCHNSVFYLYISRRSLKAPKFVMFLASSLFALSTFHSHPPVSPVEVISTIFSHPADRVSASFFQLSVFNQGRCLSKEKEICSVLRGQKCQICGTVCNVGLTPSHVHTVHWMEQDPTENCVLAIKSHITPFMRVLSRFTG